MATLSIRLFGAIEIERDGTALTDFRSQKALTLLAYLISEKRLVTREYLAGLGWPDTEQSQALGLLRRSLHDLNSQLPRNTQRPANWVMRNMPRKTGSHLCTFQGLLMRILIRKTTKSLSISAVILWL